MDLWGGIADAGSARPWTRDTLVNTYSVTKTMTALVALKLIDQGKLDPHAPVARYWPEFGAEGKHNVLVRHVLGHTSGVCGWARAMNLPEVYDTERAAALLAAQPPWWVPGSGSGYQAINHGHLIGEIVRRITGRTLGTVLCEEFTEPLAADYWLGAPESVDSRVATLVPPPRRERSSTVDLNDIAVRTLRNPIVDPATATSRDFLAAELGGLNGQGNARSVAQMQAIVSHGGDIAGNRYLSQSTLDSVFDVQSDGPDRVLGAHLRFGLGYALPSPSVPAIPTGRVCWWTGFGGSIVVNDMDRRLTMAYVMNKMDPVIIGAANGIAYLRAVYACLDG